MALAQVLLDLQPEGREMPVKPSKRSKVFKLGWAEMLRAAIATEAQQVVQIVKQLPGTVSTLAGAAAVGIVLACVAVLAGSMGAIRARLKSQRIDLERALERIGELATRDDLTGLTNRRHMTALMQSEQAHQRRGDSKMTIALLDIDLFKRINDTFGHPAGDAVLRAFAESSRKVLRATDVLARWGGEEFLLMLPGTAPEQSLHSVEPLRESLAQISFDAIQPGLKVTFSAGFSACDDECSIEACIERADQAMYRAKTQGRNCSVLA